ncbi:hypothetical protein [Hymenobacter armeniacus]|uniref:DUF4468 domain-containing protein n=1 Tax=Hymenobacter armeniacus TaxID=2771358 RepID=A0ABR8K236_9BACT|nr:hypothetical protein [Hymenobacter armeniacus]MBD2724584.1 hypothetical protein [Hymenobacter armeniacus]
MPLWERAPLPWPRNRAGQVEVSGVLPWPAADTLVRQDLVWRWYRAKLTDEAPAELDSLRRAGHYAFRYAGVPPQLHFSYRGRERVFHLTADVQVTPAPQGLRYRFSGFRYLVVNDDNSVNYDLESALTNPYMDPHALAAFRQRVATATTW